MTDAVADKILLAGPNEQSAAKAPTIVRVAKEAGVNPIAQFSQLMRLSNRTNGLTSQEYYEFQVYRRDLSWAEKKAFVGEKGSYRLNKRLAPPQFTGMRGFLRDKVTFEALLRQIGISCTNTQAVFAAHREFGSIRTLHTTDDLHDFLAHGAEFPLFGKPAFGLQAKGTGAILSYDKAARVLHLSSGRDVLIDDFVEEVIGDFADCYMFQSMVEQHQDVIDVAGKSVATARVVTVVQDEVPEVLYSIWKIPAPKAVSDNFWQPGSMICHIDEMTGEVKTCRRNTGPDTEWHNTHPVTGEQIVGKMLPNWDAVREIAVKAHSIFPVNGFLGWDIAMTPDGAKIIECNTNSGHMLYQLASGRGAMNPDFMPVFERVIARNKRVSIERNQSWKRN